jgi:hypothetical protein
VTIVRAPGETSENRLRWIKSIRTNSAWHLTFDAEETLCSGVAFAPGLRHHIRFLNQEPPPDSCEECVEIIRKMLDL